MSRLEALVSELCPEGVPYRTLSSIGAVVRGKRFVKSDMIEAGVPCIHYGEIYTKYGISAAESFSFVSEERARTLRFAQPGDVIMASAGETVEDIGKSVAWLGGEPIAIHDACYAFSSSMDPTFVSYFFASRAFRDQIKQQISSSKISSISTQNVARARIPVPPLLVQQEIVRILDKYSDLDVRLRRELELELEARRRQYEHYRDEALDFDADTPVRALGDVILNLRTGLNPRTNFSLNTADAKNYYVTVRELMGFEVRWTEKTDRINDAALALINRRSKLKVGDVLFSGTGTIGRTAVVSTKPDNWNVKEGVYAITPNPSILRPRYLVHLVRTRRIKDKLESIAMGGTVKSVSMADLKRVQIPVPSLGRQDEVCKLLDNLDSLVGQLSANVPEELRARQRQYEHYRDQLVTFKEASA